MRRSVISAIVVGLCLAISAQAQAQKVPSGVPAQTVTESPAAPKSGGAGTTGGPREGVNINTASTEDLHKLPGMTTQRVSAIIRGRPYGSVDELSGRKIIKQSTLERIRPYIVVQ